MSGAIQLTSADFPGYAAAVARENLVRAAACLGLTERVCGVDCAMLTCRKVRLLALVNSPFLLRNVTVDQLMSKPGIDIDVLGLLWICSTAFRPSDLRSRDRFFKRHRALLTLPLPKLVAEIMTYVEDSYLDAPEPEDGKSYYAFEVGIAASLHRTYGLPIDFWNDADTSLVGRLRALYRGITGTVSPLDVPLKIYWQLQKAERQFMDAKGILSNASDKFLAAGLTAINARNRRQAEYERELMAEKPKPWTDEQRAGASRFDY